MAGIDSYTVLCLHFDSDFSDSSTSSHTVTAEGGAQVSSAQSVFGGASCLFNGSTGLLSVPDSPAWYFASGDFAIDFRLRLDSVAVDSTILCQRQDASNYWRFEYDDPNGLRFSWANDGAQNLISQGATTGWGAGTWYHVAVCRYGDEFTLFRDGSIIAGPSTIAVAINDYSGTLCIGQAYPGVDPVAGFVDELRISKGVSRYGTSAFTPAAAAYSNGILVAGVGASFSSSGLNTSVAEAAGALRFFAPQTVQVGAQAANFTASGLSTTTTEAATGLASNAKQRLEQTQGARFQSLQTILESQGVAFAASHLTEVGFNSPLAHHALLRQRFALYEIGADGFGTSLGTVCDGTALPAIPLSAGTHTLELRSTRNFWEDSRHIRRFTVTVASGTSYMQRLPVLTALSSAIQDRRTRISWTCSAGATEVADGFKLWFCGTSPVPYTGTAAATVEWRSGRTDYSYTWRQGSSCYVALAPYDGTSYGSYYELSLPWPGKAPDAPYQFAVNPIHQPEATRP